MTREEIRHLEKKSIRDFLEVHKQYLTGKVLDFGCGDMPYKDLIDGQYIPYDKDMIVNSDENLDAILCTQVLQELIDVENFLLSFKYRLKKGGYLVITFPTCWEEYGPDLWRFTAKGMEKMLEFAGFNVLKMTPRFSIPFEDFSLVVGYGCIAQS